MSYFDSLPETKILDNTTSYEAVVLHVEEKNSISHVIFDQTAITNDKEGTIFTDHKKLNIIGVRDKNGVIIHKVDGIPDCGEIVRIEI